jgi:D-glycero-D-manno-heptose 1,7-bisphosphate phosphatase
VKAVFLDRDGTLNVDVGYLHRLEDLELFPWTADALRLLKRAGYTLVVVTNQSGIAHGLIRPEFIGECHAEMRRRLQPAGADLDALYYCTHHPRGAIAELAVECRCRKPRPGMVEDAVRDLGVDPATSWVVGDKWLDVIWGTPSARARSWCAPAGAPSRSSAGPRASRSMPSATTSFTPSQ